MEYQVLVGQMRTGGVEFGVLWDPRRCHSQLETGNMEPEVSVGESLLVGC